MVIAALVLAFSSALFFFYLQTVCERVLQREFSHPYFQEVVNAIRLEYPRLREAASLSGPLEYTNTRLALECDFMTLSYLLKNADHMSWREKVLFLYFRFLLLSLSIRHALKVSENGAVVKLATILQFFANLLGERLSAQSFDNALPKGRL